MKEITLALKPRTDIIRSPKERYNGPHKKDLCPPKIKKNMGHSTVSKVHKILTALWLSLQDYLIRHSNSLQFRKPLGDPKELKKKMTFEYVGIDMI